MKLTQEQLKMLLRARKSKQYTQAKAASRAGIGSSYWCAVERGLRQPSLLIAGRMFKAVGLSLEVVAHE